MSAPSILVAKHKHYNSYYVVTSAEDLLRAKAQMLREWDRNGMFYEPENEPYINKKDKEIGLLTDEQIAALPEVFQEPAKKARRNILAAQRRHEQEKADYALARQVLDAPSIDEAIKVTVPGSDRNAVDRLVNTYGQQEYTEWETEYTQSLDDWNS